MREHARRQAGRVRSMRNYFYKYGQRERSDEEERMKAKKDI